EGPGPSAADAEMELIAAANRAEDETKTAKAMLQSLRDGLSRVKSLALGRGSAPTAPSSVPITPQQPSSVETPIVKFQGAESPVDLRGSQLAVKQASVSPSPAVEKGVPPREKAAAPASGTVSGPRKRASRIVEKRRSANAAKGTAGEQRSAVDSEE